MRKLYHDVCGWKFKYSSFACHFVTVFVCIFPIRERFEGDDVVVSGEIYGIIWIWNICIWDILIWNIWIWNICIYFVRHGFFPLLDVLKFVEEMMWLELFEFGIFLFGIFVFGIFEYLYLEYLYVFC